MVERDCDGEIVEVTVGVFIADTVPLNDADCVSLSDCDADRLLV